MAVAAAPPPGPVAPGADPVLPVPRAPPVPVAALGPQGRQELRPRHRQPAALPVDLCLPAANPAVLALLRRRLDLDLVRLADLGLVVPVEVGLVLPVDSAGCKCRGQPAAVPVRPVRESHQPVVVPSPAGRTQYI